MSAVWAPVSVWSPNGVIAMAVIRDGVPVRCWTFPGNTADTAISRTVEGDLAGWNLSRMVWAPTAGSPRRRTGAYLTRGGGHYVHAEKLRATNDEAAAALARPGRYRTVAGNLRVKGVASLPAGTATGTTGCAPNASWSATTPSRPTGTPPSDSGSSRT